MLRRLTVIVLIGYAIHGLPSTGHAQDFECGTLVEPEDIAFEVKRVAEGWDYPPAPLTAGLLEIPVVFHIVRRADGTGGQSVSELPPLLQGLNTAFVQVGFAFYEL